MIAAPLSQFDKIVLATVIIIVGGAVLMIVLSLVHYVIGTIWGGTKRSIGYDENWERTDKSAGG